jgi:hypothetical protein
MSRLHARLGLFCSVIAMGCGGADPDGARNPSGGAGGTQGTAGMYNPVNPVAGSGNPGGISGGLGGVGGVAGVGDNSCASIRVQANRVIPTVQLVIDGSGSMEDDFGNTTRWGAVRDALLSETGVVQRLESVVEFGMSIYQTGGMNSCPILTGPAPTIGNFAAIEAAWLEEPGGATPTAEAMEAVVASMSGTVAGPDEVYAPQIIILATDGAPNGCAGGLDWALWATCTFINPMDPACAGLNMMLENDGYVRTLQAAKDAQAKGIDVYVLDLSEGGLNQAELQKVANVGVGLEEAATPPAPLYVPSDPAALAAALETIIGGAASCSVALEGEIKDTTTACGPASKVTLDGEPLVCGDPNGWRIVDPTHIELVGDACTRWLGSTDSGLDARFPCNLVVVQ